MKTKMMIAAGLMVSATLWIQCKSDDHKAPVNLQADTEVVHDTIEVKVKDPVARGLYLVNIMGCDDCHTPKMMTPQGPVPDMSRRLMGHPAEEKVSVANKKDLIKKEHVAILSGGMTSAAGPWGVSFAANLTPDDTGLGNWTEAQFLKALKEGKLKGLDGSRPLLPPMPWQVYRNLTDDDMKAIFAYIKTIKPIKNLVPAPMPL